MQFSEIIRGSYGRLRWISKALYRNPICGVRDAIRAFDVLREVDRTASAMQVTVKARDGNLVQWTTPMGDFWTPDVPESFIRFTIAEEIEDVYQTFRMIPGAIVLDCGGNVGAFTRKALSCGAARVIAVEADAQNAECFKRNFSTEIREGTVIVVLAAAWSTPGMLRLSRPDPGNPGGNTVMEDCGTEVEAVTIDSLVTDLQRLDFVKIDIEGAEQEALAGARQAISRYKPLISVATEHTASFLTNSQAVRKLVLDANSTYRMTVGGATYDGPYITPTELIFY